MLKKVLVVAAVLCVMVPFAAQDKAGKWGVELSGWFVRPLSLDTTYAYGYYGVGTSTGANFTQRPYSVGNEYRWTPNLKVSYATDAFTFWFDYTSYDQTSSSTANAATDNQYFLNPTLPNGQYLFTYADTAAATLRTTYTNWDINAGHVFHPTDKWALMVYGGIRYLRLENDAHVIYVDEQNWNYWGPGATDAVRLHANMTGWGLNFGFQNDFTFGKRWALGTGLEVSMVRTTNDLDQNEMLDSPYYGVTYGITGISSTKQKVTPALKMYAEAKFNFNDSWYGKIGYRFDFIKDAFGFDYTGTPDFSATGYNGGYFPTNKDVTFDGLYFTLGFKF